MNKNKSLLVLIVVVILAGIILFSVLTPVISGKAVTDLKNAASCNADNICEIRNAVIEKSIRIGVNRNITIDRNGNIVGNIKIDGSLTATDLDTSGILYVGRNGEAEFENLGLPIGSLNFPIVSGNFPQIPQPKKPGNTSAYVCVDFGGRLFRSDVSCKGE